MPCPIDLWFWPLDQDADRTAALARHLTPAEATRAARYIRPQDGDRFRIGRGHMRAILAQYHGGRPEDLTFDLVGRDKPVLRGGPAFNLSHAGGWAALAVAPEHPDLELGIDIEAPRKVDRALAEHVLSPCEINALYDVSEPEREAGFLNAWTRKEALIKATGIGLGVNLRRIEVTLRPEDPARVLVTTDPLPPPRDWDLCALATGAGLPGAVAAVTGGERLGPFVVREGDLPLTPRPRPAPAA
ncbi:MAG: 4'-phosphopantetheinyl transferase family protein [Marinibacterium sp.]